MKIAKITALFPPAVIGGAEISAANLAVRMTECGHDVSVLSTTTQSDEAGVVRETYAERIDVWRYRMPRAYTALDYADHSASEKLIWHAQDHIDRRNRRVWSDFLDKTRPDVAFVHVAQGLGYNGLTELGRRDIPTVMVLHDLSLACYKMAMFSNGRPCETQHPLCRVSSHLKLRYLRQIPRLGFVSPSRANYETVCRFLPIADHPHRVILNANGYDLSTDAREPSSSLRLIYAGQVAEPKGVGFLMDVVDKLPPGIDVTLRVVGDGPDLERLRSLYGTRPWVTFEGRVRPTEVSRLMAKADILCVPSLWPENSPGVIGQGMACGLAVFGSRKGGIPELVEDGVTGRILAPGDAAAWTEAITSLVRDRTPLQRWSTAVGDVARSFDPNQSVRAYLAFAESVIASMPR